MHNKGRGHKGLDTISACRDDFYFSFIINPNVRSQWKSTLFVDESCKSILLSCQCIWRFINEICIKTGNVENSQMNRFFVCLIHVKLKCINCAHWLPPLVSWQHHSDGATLRSLCAQSKNKSVVILGLLLNDLYRYSHCIIKSVESNLNKTK